MRGIPAHKPHPPLPGRFTPAHAGNTFLDVKRLYPTKVHPRPCGEYEIHDLTKALIQGSPPLTRGIHSQKKKQRRLSRFTPAHAGNTHPEILFLLRLQVHPRSRGEYKALDLFRGFYLGSPPLTRGILSNYFFLPLRYRFTPAHAGNTVLTAALSLSIEVHPRSRGEYTGLNALRIFALGSPPLTRGILSQDLRLCSITRFTPAHAGNTGH